jgi:hypothetical protein
MTLNSKEVFKTSSQLTNVKVVTVKSVCRFTQGFRLVSLYNNYRNLLWNQENPFAMLYFSRFNIILVYTFLWNICFHPYVKMTCKPGLWWQWYVNQAWGEPVVPLASIFYSINQNLIKLEWNLSKPNLLVTKVCVQIIQVKIKISYIRTLLMCLCIIFKTLIGVQYVYINKDSLVHRVFEMNQHFCGFNKFYF